MRWKKSSAALFAGMACLHLLPNASRADGDNGSTTKGVTNSFFALQNCVEDSGQCTPESQAAMLKELGYAGIHHSGVQAIPETLAALDESGLKLFTVYVGAWLDGDEPKYPPQLKEVIKTLKGRDTMIWLTVRSATHKPSSPDADARAVEIVGEIADLAAASGLRVALYPHFGFWLERAEDAVRVTKKVDRKNVGVTFNLCHWLKVDDVKTMQARLKLALPYLFVVTINGADTKGGWDRLIQTLDRGSFNVQPFLAALKVMGYTGPIGLQCYGIKGDVRTNLQRSMSAWRKLCAAIAAEKE